MPGSLTKDVSSGCCSQRIGKASPTASCSSRVLMTLSHIGARSLNSVALPMMTMPCLARDNATFERFSDWTRCQRRVAAPAGMLDEP